MIFAGALFCSLGVWRESNVATYVGASVCIVIVLLQPFRGVLGSVYRGWMRFSSALAWINTRIILTLLFFLIMTPMGLFMRLIGKRQLDIAVYDGDGSAWKECDDHREGHWEQMY